MFDTINQGRSLFKVLMKIEFPIAVGSYPRGRAQKVLFNFVLSEEITASSGIPQGSHLGPLLFILFMNELLSVIHRFHILMHAIR